MAEKAQVDSSTAAAAADGSEGDEALIECPVDDAHKAAVLAAVKHYNKETGKNWHVSNVNKVEAAEDGSASVDLVLCSGEMCTMKKFSVNADGVASTVAPAGGGFLSF